MPNFFYTAKRSTGETISGTMDAVDERELASLLRRENLFLVHAEGAALPSAASSFWARVFSFMGRVKARDLIFFTRNLGVMIGAGMPVLRSLEVLASQSPNPALSKVIHGMADDVRKGVPLSEAISKHPKVFGPIFQNMIAAGESSGRLEESLKVLTRQIRRDYELLRKVRGALYYPAIIVFAMAAVGVLMMIYVVPSLTSAFKELNIELPATTRLIIAVSESLISYALIVVLTFLIFMISLIVFLRTASGKQTLSWVLLHLPLFRTLTMQVNLARFARTLSSLIGAGVHILEALNISAHVLVNPYYMRAILEGRAGVERGESFSLVLSRHPKLFPALFLQMTSVGEETGKLGDMLSKIAFFYESEVAQATKNMSTLIEPILMVIVGAAVGLFAVSVIQPIYSVVGTI